MAKLKEWYVRSGKVVQGPFTSAELKRLTSECKVKPNTQVSQSRDGNWFPAAKIIGLDFSNYDKLLERGEQARLAAEALKPESPDDDNQEKKRMGELAMSFVDSPASRPQAPTDASNFIPAVVQPPQPPPYATIQQMPPQPIQQTVVNVIQHSGGRKWEPGVAALLSFLIPGLGQMYKGQVLNGLLWFVLTFIGYLALIIPGLILHVMCVVGAASGDPERRY